MERLTALGDARWHGARGGRMMVSYRIDPSCAWYAIISTYPSRLLALSTPIQNSVALSGPNRFTHGLESARQQASTRTGGRSEVIGNLSRSEVIK